MEENGAMKTSIIILKDMIFLCCMPLFVISLGQGE